MEFKKEQIEYLAELAKLHVDTSKVSKLHKQLKDILAYVSQLTSLTDLPATAKFDDPVKTVNVWREDVVEPLPEIGRQAILNSTPDRQDDLIKTKPVFPLRADSSNTAGKQSSRTRSAWRGWLADNNDQY